MDTIDLTGQVAVVTGAGRGMGRTHALDLARRGATVVVNDLPEDGVAQAVVAEIVAAGGNAVAIEGSVAAQDGAETLLGTVFEQFGRVDILIYNAGIVRSSPYEIMSDEQLNSVLEVNLLGMMFATRAAYRQMKARSYGRIVIIGSQVGLLGMHGGMVNYGATKGAALGVTVNLARETEGSDVHINLVMPSAATTITAKFQIAGNTQAAKGSPAYYKQRFADRFAPEVATALVTYLVSPGCTVNGELFSVLGARYSRAAIAVSTGWLAPEGLRPTAEDIAAHIDSIRSLDSVDFPESMQQAYDLLGSLLD